MHTPTTTATGARWLTDRELADEWHVSRSSIHRLRRAGMPSLVLGRLRRYDPDACVEWLQSREAA